MNKLLLAFILIATSASAQERFFSNHVMTGGSHSGSGGGSPTGAAGGDLAGSYPNPSLVSTGTSGTYTKVSTDTKGRVVSGSQATTSDIAEGANLYYTASRFNTAFGAKNTNNLAEGSSNLYFTTGRASAAAPVQSIFGRTGTIIPTLGDYSTSLVTEGSNLYYTQGRFDTAFGLKSTTDLAEGTNLYFTAGRFNSAFSGKSTSDLAEGTNLYYTDGRADARITAQKGATNGLASLDGAGKVPMSQIPPGLIGAVNYQGTWDAASNTPTLASGVGTKGYYYIVSTAGTTNIDGHALWHLGDWILFNGTTWDLVDNNQSVSTVFGRQGSITAQSTDYSSFYPLLSNNFSDIPSPSTARSNLGLANIASSGAYADLSGAPSSLPPNGTAAGDLTGTYPNPTLAAVGSAGTYTKVTTDSKGRVISGTTLSSADIPNNAANTSGNAATVTTNANLTGPITSVGNATAIADGAIAVTKIGGTSTYVPYFDSTGFMGTDSAFTFNDTTKTLTATNLVGTLTGNITGNILGSTIVMGNGDGATPSSLTLRAPAATGTNVAGADWTIQASNGTGTAGGGAIVFQTAPAASSTVTMASSTGVVNNNTSSITLSHDGGTGTNRMLVVQIAEQYSISVSSVTYNGVSLTKLGAQLDGGSSIQSEMWYLIAPATGVNNVVITFSSFTDAVVRAVNLTGVNQTTPFGVLSKTASAYGTTVSLTPASNAGDFILDQMTAYAATPSVTAGQTLIGSAATSGLRNMADAYKTGTAGTTTVSYSASTSAWLSLMAVAVKPATSGGADIMADVLRLTNAGNVLVSALTPSRVVVSDASKQLTSSTTTSTELGYLSGVTSAVQTQLNKLGALPVANISTATTLSTATATSYFCTVTGGAFTVTLPAASANSGAVFLVKNISFGSANSVTVARTGADLIENTTSDTLAAGIAHKYTSNGTAWFIVP